MNQWLEIV
jgi:hypothetical protein